MDRAVFLLLAVAGVLVVCPAAAGMNRESFNDDPRSSILIDRFSFSSHGMVSLSVAGAKVTSSAVVDPSLLGFFLLSDEALFKVITYPDKLAAIMMLYPNHDPSASCVLSSLYAIPLFTFADLDHQGHYNRTFPITHAGEYSLFFASCPAETKVTMEVHTHMYNAIQAGR